MVDVFVTSGEELFVDTLAADPMWVEMGTGGVAAVKGDTANGTPVETRTSATISQPTASTLRYVGTIAATAARAIIEIGVFDASTVGIMIARSDIPVINLANGDSLEITYDLLVA